MHPKKAKRKVFITYQKTNAPKKSQWKGLYSHSKDQCIQKASGKVFITSQKTNAPKKTSGKVF